MFGLKATILCIDDHRNGLIGRKMLLEENFEEIARCITRENGKTISKSCDRSRRCGRRHYSRDVFFDGARRRSIARPGERESASRR